MAAAISDSLNTHTFLTVPVPSGYDPTKPLRAIARSWRLFTERKRAASSAETKGSGALTVSDAMWEGLTAWRVRRSSNSDLVSDMFCSPKARKTSGSEISSASTSSLNRMPRLRTRNLALRVSAIEWTAAHATRPSLSDVKRF